jgi:hypothetical protein
MGEQMENKVQSAKEGMSIKDNDEVNDEEDFDIDNEEDILGTTGILNPVMNLLNEKKNDQAKGGGYRDYAFDMKKREPQKGDKVIYKTYDHLMLKSKNFGHAKTSNYPKHREIDHTKHSKYHPEIIESAHADAEDNNEDNVVMGQNNIAMRTTLCRHVLDEDRQVIVSMALRDSRGRKKNEEDMLEHDCIHTLKQNLFINIDDIGGAAGGNGMHGLQSPIGIKNSLIFKFKPGRQKTKPDTEHDMSPMSPDNGHKGGSPPTHRHTTMDTERGTRPADHTDSKDNVPTMIHHNSYTFSEILPMVLRPKVPASPSTHRSKHSMMQRMQSTANAQAEKDKKKISNEQNGQIGKAAENNNIGGDSIKQTPTNSMYENTQKPTKPTGNLISSFIARLHTNTEDLPTAPTPPSPLGPSPSSKSTRPTNIYSIQPIANPKLSSPDLPTLGKKPPLLKKNKPANIKPLPIKQNMILNNLARLMTNMKTSSGSNPSHKSRQVSSAGNRVNVNQSVQFIDDRDNMSQHGTLSLRLHTEDNANNSPSRLDSSENWERMGSHRSSHGNKGPYVNILQALRVDDDDRVPPSRTPVSCADILTSSQPPNPPTSPDSPWEGVKIISAHPAHSGQTATVRSLDSLTDIPLNRLIGIIHEVFTRHNLDPYVDNHSLKIHRSNMGIDITVTDIGILRAVSVSTRMGNSADIQNTVRGVVRDVYSVLNP